MGTSKHGMIIYDAKGELLHVEPGHLFGKDRIVELIEEHS